MRRPFCFLNILNRLQNDRLRVQRKYFGRRCGGFYIEIIEKEIQFRTTNRKKPKAIPLVGAGECVRGLEKPHPLFGKDASKPRKAKASFR